MHIVFLLTILFTPFTADAHILSGEGGFATGLSHPVLGLDHLLAMVSVGIVSAQIGGRAIWTVPATFVIVMAIGGIMGMNDIRVPYLELGIASSVILLGLAIAMDKRFPVVFAMLFVGFFAIFHGNAHGQEMPNISDPMLYALGFMSGTALLHIAGVFIGLFFKWFKARRSLSYSGAVVMGIGVHIMLGLFGY